MRVEFLWISKQNIQNIENGHLEYTKESRSLYFAGCIQESFFFIFFEFSEDKTE